MIRPIAIALSPNTQKDDIQRALSFFVKPQSVIYGQSVSTLERWFKKYFSCLYAVSFASGRAALFSILTSLRIGKGDEVLLQSFTCVAVPDCILETGATPVYVDINKTLTLDTKSIERKITKKTKAIVVQHTFGIPSDMETILALAKKHTIFVIEDAAHGIGGLYNNKKLGTFSDAAFFSFGRDKAFSSVFGGMAITNNNDIGKKIKIFHDKLSYPSFFWTLQQLFHPVAFAVILPLYNVGIGKLILVVFQKLCLLSFPVSPVEKKGKIEKKLLKQLSNSLAQLTLFQLSKIKKYNTTREEIGDYYRKEIKKLNSEYACDRKIPFLRFPVFVKDPTSMISYFKKHNIYLGNWYHNIIDPKGTDFTLVGYEIGSCPQAEHFARHVVNLPTYPTMKFSDAEKVVAVLKAYVSNNRN